MMIPRLPHALALLFAAGLTAAPLRAEEAPRCTYVEVADMPLKYVGQGLVPAVDGVIDGTPAVMLVDTGAFETSLTMNGVVKRDLTLHMTGRTAEGISGFTRLYGARVGEFAIGPVKSPRKQTNLLVIGETTFTPAYDAMVGAPFLLQADMEFDLRAKHMKFFRPLNCGRDRSLAYWKEDAVAVPFEFSRSDSPNPHFNVVVNGKELDAVISTGTGHSFLTLRGARHLGIDVKGKDVKQLGTIGGVGSDRAALWVAPVQSVDIGGEIIKDVELGIVDVQSDTEAELFLGQDFLRAHRVLFAMSQRKVYLAYLGGEVFSRRAGLEPWIRQEADSGNADAQYTIAYMYNNGRGVARDKTAAQSWLEKAGAAGQPNARLALGRQQMQAGHFDAAIPQLRAALDQLPAERLGTLWLFNARVHQGQAELAKSELASSVKKQNNDDWPAPIADFYLGKLDAKDLMEAAAKDKQSARARTCMANAYMREWHVARGEKPQAEALLASFRADCAPVRPAGAAAAPALAPAAAPGA
jgi:predicted aspartyl protease